MPWRNEIRDGIAACSKFVMLVDEAWLTSYNCLEVSSSRIVRGPWVGGGVRCTFDGLSWRCCGLPWHAGFAQPDADPAPPLLCLPPLAPRSW